MGIEYDEIYGRDQQLRVRARFHARHEILLPEFRDPAKPRDVSNIALPGVLGVPVACDPNGGRRKTGCHGCDLRYCKTSFTPVVSP